MDHSLALIIVALMAGALTLSSVLYQRQQREVARRLRVHKLKRTTQELDESLALLDALGTSMALREFVHGMRQALVQVLADIDPDTGWATRLSEEAPDSPGSVKGPFPLSSLNAIKPVQLRVSQLREAVTAANPDPDILQELTELYFMVDVDTVIAHCVELVQNGREHETVGRLLGKARNTLKYKLISQETRDDREAQIKQVRAGIARQVRAALEGQLQSGDAVERAFMDMLSQPPGVK